jgi:4-hydroxymandelate oxidase
MREQCGGFPSIHSLDEVEGLGANLPGGHCGALTWADIQWMAELTPMQLIVKGIMTAEDAACAASCPGVAAIVVSNHGGRQLDGCLGSAEALEECVDAVASSGLEVLVDGGVRRGRDVLRALALGASAVFIGRPCDARPRSLTPHPHTCRQARRHCAVHLRRP